jgi:dipeptidyl aminopeptidase/acylaminoacyl peptidase
MYRKCSAYFWPEKINAPVLILHGGDDWRVKVTQAENWKNWARLMN